MIQKVHFRLTSVAQKRCCLLKLPSVDISDSPDFNQIKSNQVMYLLCKGHRKRNVRGYPYRGHSLQLSTILYNGLYVPTGCSPASFTASSVG